MNLIEQLSKFKYDLYGRVKMVLNSDASSLEQLKEELCYFGSAEEEDITFSTRDGHLYLHYTFRNWCCDDSDGQLVSVQLPDLFVTDFEEFMKQAQ